MSLARGTQSLLIGVMLLPIGGCDMAFSNFVGRVYDGASGDRLTEYTIYGQYWKTTRKGQVDDGGRYTLGPIPEGQDYTITVEAEGYRSFMSHNAMFFRSDRADRTSDLAQSSWTRLESYYYDAYLYPLGLPSPAVTFDIGLAQTDAKAAGVIRLEPSTGPSLTDSTLEPVGVDDGEKQRQIWVNDEDMQFRSVTRSFTDGVVDFAEGELVYGVTYDVTIFDVDGYDIGTGQYTSGLDDHLSWTLQPLNYSDLDVVFISTELGLWSEDGTVTIVFNQPIQWFAEERLEVYEEALDNGTSINSPDDDADGDRNVLNNVSEPGDNEDDDQENGTSMEISGDRLILRWNSSAGLDDTDGDDPILSLTYGGLNAVNIQGTRGPITNRNSVGAILGSNSVTVDLVP